MCNEETYYGDCTYIHVAEYTCYPVWPTNIRSVMPPAEDKSIMVQFFTESDWHGDSRAGVPVEWPGGISLGKEVQEAGYFMAIVKA